MYCRFSIISFIMLLNISKTRAVKIKRIYDMYCRFSLAQKERPESYALASVQFIYPCSSASQPSQMD